MTIIAAAQLSETQYAMASDSLATGGNGMRVPAEVPKFHVGPNFMVGLAGSYHCFNKLKQALSSIHPGQECPETIVDALHQINQGHRDEWDSVALFVNQDGIWEIDGALSIIKVDTTYHAVGSGQECALGYLTGQIIGQDREFVTEQELLVSVAVCVELLVHCGGSVVYNIIGEEAKSEPTEEIQVDNFPESV